MNEMGIKSFDVHSYLMIFHHDDRYLVRLSSEDYRVGVIGGNSFDIPNNNKMLQKFKGLSVDKFVEFVDNICSSYSIEEVVEND